jgi:hypothetical protein
MPTLIIGSKPNPFTSVNYDKVFFVNGSIYYNTIDKDSYKYHLVSYTQFENTNINSASKKLAPYIGKQVDEIIIMINDNNKRPFTYYENKLHDLNYSYNKIVFLSKYERARIYSDQINRLDRIKWIFKDKYSFNLITLYLFNLLFNSSKEHAPVRPSSGVFSILYALSRKIELDKIYISGIGIKDLRHSHDHNQIYNQIHLKTDLNILRYLNNKYPSKIISTDKDLAESTGLQLIIP